MLLAPFTHLHVDTAPHDHGDQPDHSLHGVVHTHVAVHQHHDHGYPAGNAAHWDHADGMSSVSLDPMPIEVGQGPVTLAMLEGAYDPPATEQASGRPALTLARAHGPPEEFPVIGRAPPV